MKETLEYFKTPHMKETAIQKCDELISHVQKNPPKKKSWNYNYLIQRKIENLAIFGFYCYWQLHEYDKAIHYFKKNFFMEKNKEIQLYVLLNLINETNQKNIWIREYELALKNGIQPRKKLVDQYDKLKQTFC